MDNMEREEILNQKEKQIVYLSASIASGCRPCTKYHLRRSYEFGLSDFKIKKSIALAISIRNNATHSMESLASNHNSGENIEEDNQVSINRNNILVGIAAAYSVNFPSYLEKYMSIARTNGVCDEELSEIIKISKSVNDMARAHVDIITDKIGIEPQGEHKNKNDCCRSCDC